jgi:hypothetical protein
MIAQSVRTQLAFQFLVAVLAFAVFVVRAAGQSASAGVVGYHGSAVGALGMGFALDDKPQVTGASG